MHLLNFTSLEKKYDVHWWRNYKNPEIPHMQPKYPWEIKRRKYNKTRDYGELNRQTSSDCQTHFIWSNIGKMQNKGLHSEWYWVRVLISFHLVLYISQGNGHYFPLKNQSPESHNPLLSNEDLWEESDDSSEEESQGESLFLYVMFTFIWCHFLNILHVCSSFIQYWIIYTLYYIQYTIPVHLILRKYRFYIFVEQPHAWVVEPSLLFLVRYWTCLK